MINGAKLLYVAGLSRGESEAILENEVRRHVVEFGPEHLIGVWYVFHSPYWYTLTFLS